MAKLASGKKSVAISDRSGFKIKYTDLKTTWDGLRVEPSEWEPKHPQLTPAKNVVDATALFQPRPDNDPENVDIFLGYSQDIFASRVQRSQTGVGIKGLGSIGHIGISLDEPVTGQAGTGAIGDYAPGFEVDGVSGTGAIGTAVAEDQVDVSATGTEGTGAVGDATGGASSGSVSATGAIGTGTFQNDRVFDVTGESGTGATGTSSLEMDAQPSSAIGTGAIGDETPATDVIATGVAGTEGIGDFGEEGDGQLNLSIQGVGAAGIASTGDEQPQVEAIAENDTGFGEQYWGYGTWSGDPEVVGIGSVGSVTIDIFYGPNPATGTEGSTAIGAYAPESQITETGVAGTGNTGTVTLDSDVDTTGISGTGAIGTSTPSINPGYGEGTWGEDTWGN